MKSKVCELCKEEASVYCWADAAFLCWKCDEKVHQANFLVARHLRNILCTKCKSSFCEKSICSLSHASHNSHLCKSCSFQNLGDFIASSSSSSCSTLSFSSSADCVSTNESSSTEFKPKNRVVRHVSNSNRLEGIFGIWCKKVGVNRRAVVLTAVSALRSCVERLAALPFRVSLAAAFWVGLKMSGDRSIATWQNLRRLEELSGVPAKLIVAVEPRLARLMRLRRRISHDLEEGWAECNG